MQEDKDKALLLRTAPSPHREANLHLMVDLLQPDKALRMVEAHRVPNHMEVHQCQRRAPPESNLTDQVIAVEVLRVVQAVMGVVVLRRLVQVVMAEDLKEALAVMVAVDLAAMVEVRRVDRKVEVDMAEVKRAVVVMAMRAKAMAMAYPFSETLEWISPFTPRYQTLDSHALPTNILVTMLIRWPNVKPFTFAKPMVDKMDFYARMQLSLINVISFAIGGTMLTVRWQKAILD